MGLTRNLTATSLLYDIVCVVDFDMHKDFVVFSTNRGILHNKLSNMPCWMVTGRLLFDFRETRQLPHMTYSLTFINFVRSNINFIGLDGPILMYV